jgi:hypothetical protein
MTASFFYIDVIALVLASITAAILTTVWVQRSPYATLFSTDTDSPKSNDPKFHFQRKLGAESKLTDSQSCSSLPSSATTSIAYGDNSAVSGIITEILDSAQQKPNHFAEDTSWSKKLMETVTEKWTDGRIILVLSDRQVFGEAGLGDCWSVSEHDNGILRITMGFLDAMEVELYLSRSHQALAHL